MNYSTFNPLRYLISFSVLVLTWTVVYWSSLVPRFFLPSPLLVAQTLWKERAMFLFATAITLRNALIGGLVGISLGIAIGIAIAYSKILRWLAEPFLVIFQSFPREALFPLSIAWLGFGSMTKIVNAALLSFFPIALMTLSGLLNVRGDYLALVRGWGASKWEEFRFCRFPAFVPTLMAAIKVAVTLSLIGAVLGEFMGSNEGLGYVIITSTYGSRLEAVFCALMMLGLLGITISGALQGIQNRFLKRFYQE